MNVVRSPRARAVALAAAAIALLGLLVPGAGSGGTPPNRLDANLGVVLSTPNIHNLYWDDNWDAHNLFSRGTLDGFTITLATNGYLNSAAQYGVGTPRFAGSTTASFLCGPQRPPATVHFLQVLAWISCMVTIGGAPIPSPRFPISNDLYVLYLPQGTTIDDRIQVPQINILGTVIGGWTLGNQACVDYKAFHFLSVTLTGFFPWAVVVTRCSGTLAGITVGASHEIVEAATDPVPTLGRIDNRFALIPRLAQGEAADICSPVGAVPSPPVILNNRSFARYWSNAQNNCVPGVGRFHVKPHHARLEPGSFERYRLTWAHPERWQDLQTLELRIRDGDETLFRVRWDEGPNTFALFDPATETWGPSGTPGSAAVLSNATGSLDLSASDARGHGPHKVALTFSLALSTGSAGRSGVVEVFATDDFGNVQGWDEAGTVEIEQQ